MFGATQSGKAYRNKGSKGPETRLLISPLQGKEEEIVNFDPSDKAKNYVNTTTNFIAITSIFTRITYYTTAIQYGKHSEVAYVQGFGK